MSSSDDSDDVPVVPPQNGRKPSTTSLESDEKSTDEAEYVNCQMEQLPCFHEATSREKARKLLEHTAVGTYLIRRSTDSGNYSVSIREATDVKHFRIDVDGDRYSFGHALFWSPFQIWEHLQERPVLECEEGIKVHLMYPYLCQPSGRTQSILYSTTRRHYIPENQDQIISTAEAKRSTFGRKRNSNCSIEGNATLRRGSTIITSMEGQLYKRKEGKNWKRRWCVLKENRLLYKKNYASKPLNELDLSTALEIKDDYGEDEKANCFRIVFPKVYFVFSANTPEDKDIWFKNIQQRIELDPIE